MNLKKYLLILILCFSSFLYSSEKMNISESLLPEKYNKKGKITPEYVDALAKKISKPAISSRILTQQIPDKSPKVPSLKHQTIFIRYTMPEQTSPSDDWRKNLTLWQKIKFEASVCLSCCLDCISCKNIPSDFDDDEC